MRLPPLLRSAEPEHCSTSLSMGIGRIYSKDLREMLTFISLRSLKFATHQIPPRKTNSGPDSRPPIRFYPGNTRAQTQIPPREKLGPRYWGHPGENSGPDTRDPQGKTRAQILGARFHSVQEKTRAPILRLIFPPGENSGPDTRAQVTLGTDLPCPRQSSCPCAPIPPCLCHHLGSSCYNLASLLGRYLRGLISIASCCRSLRES